MSSEDLRSRFEAAGQAHVFEFLDRGLVPDDKKEAFLADLAEIELDRVNTLYKATTSAPDPSSDLTPLPEIASKSTTAPDALAEWEGLALAAIARGEIGLILLAGGQGTRLGFNKPKGMFDIQLPSRKSLFQLQAERIKRAKQRAAELAGTSADSVSLPWYVMTSPMTHADTVECFEANAFYGLPNEHVFFFQQGTLPCLTNEGKIILESAGAVARAPDGNGGIYRALHVTGALAHMTKLGVNFLHAYSVDNAISPVPDPIFIGYCMAKGAELGAKACYKASPHEKVGVIALREGKPAVVEYSEISAEAAERVGDDGRLVFGAGNICVHFYTRAFLETKCHPDNLPVIFHLAQKKIPFADPASGETVHPSENTGIKLESFIFDVFPLADSIAVLEVQRSSEFSPVKNATGCDSPQTAREISSALHASWLSAAGVSLEPSDGTCEVSPLVSANGENLSKLSGQTLPTPLLVAAAGEPLPAGEVTEGPTALADGVEKRTIGGSLCVVTL